MFVQRGPKTAFLNEVLALRDGAAKVGDGETVALLQTALAAELVCVLRYTMMSVSPDALHNQALGMEFQEQANDERRHMALVAARIQALGGVPDYNPNGVTARAAALREANFAACVAENLAAEQAIIAHYKTLICRFKRRDPETCAMLEDIVRDEENHTSDLADLLGACGG
jgi:bacterioferritin